MATSDSSTRQLLGQIKDTLQVNVVSAEKSIFSGRAKMVVVTGKNGELGILPNHAPLLTSVVPGQIKLSKSDGTEELYFISGGFLEVQPDAVTILADTIVRADEIDEQQALEAKARAEKMLATKKFDNFALVMHNLHKALAQIRVLKQWRNIK